MSGLLRRIRRPGAAEESSTEPTALPEPTHGSAPLAPDGERSSAPADGRPLPAGTGPEDVERRKVAGRRGKLRRRARFLRRARELALRDLGGLVYEAGRRRQDGGALVKEKVQQLARLDEELHGLETELGAPRGETVLREPGVGGSCPRCGELHASNAHFCSRCGLDLTAAPAAPEACGGHDAGRARSERDEAGGGRATGRGRSPSRPATAATEAGAPAEPATAELPPAAPEQAGNGRTTKPETAAHTEPTAADTPDRSA